MGHPSDEPTGGQVVEEVGEPARQLHDSDTPRRSAATIERTDQAPVRPAADRLHRPGDDLRHRGAGGQPEQDREHGRTARRPGPARRPRCPSSAQDWSSQATLSGANSSAPRWSVVGLTGNVTPCSRDSSSRPPPDDDAGARRSGRRNAANIVGISRSTSRARPSSWAPGNSAGSVQTPERDAAHDRERRRQRPPTADGRGAEAHAGGRRRRRRARRPAPGRARRTPGRSAR